MLQHQSVPSNEVKVFESTTLAVEANDAVHMSNPAEQHNSDLARLRRKLPRRSFLRHINVSWESPDVLTDDKFLLLLSTLRDPTPARWRERMVCAGLIGRAALTPEQAHEAADELGNVLRNRHASRSKRAAANLRTVARQTLPFVGVALALVDYAFYAQLSLLTNHSTFIDHLLMGALGLILSLGAVGVPLFLLFLLILFPFLTAGNVTRSNRVRMAAALALARLRVPQSVGALARATLDLSPGVREVAEAGLREVLPTLTPGYYGQLDADTVPALCRLLDCKKERLFANHTHTEKLVLDVLEALEKIGDGRAVTHVESVAEEGWTENVRSAARRILPALHARQKQENDPRFLLRGASEPLAGSDQLLRAAAHSLPTAPEQLLRPGNS